MGFDAKSFLAALRRKLGVAKGKCSWQRKIDCSELDTAGCRGILLVRIDESPNGEQLLNLGYLSPAETPAGHESSRGLWELSWNADDIHAYQEELGLEITERVFGECFAGALMSAATRVIWKSRPVDGAIAQLQLSMSFSEPFEIREEIGIPCIQAGLAKALLNHMSLHIMNVGVEGDEDGDEDDDGTTDALQNGLDYVAEKSEATRATQQGSQSQRKRREVVHKKKIGQRKRPATNMLQPNQKTVHMVTDMSDLFG